MSTPFEIDSMSRFFDQVFEDGLRFFRQAEHGGRRFANPGVPPDRAAEPAGVRMSISLQPYLDDPAEEMQELGLPEEIREEAYLLARQDLLAGTIDAIDLEATVYHYQRMLFGD